jgi:lipopolysaccharide biosynthesis regulator YciM
MKDFDRNNFRIALCRFELALKRLEAAGRTEEPLTVNVLENLAKTYDALGKRDDASSDFSRTGRDK